MPNQRKIDRVSELTEKMERTQLAVVGDYRGLTVAELTELRKKLREHGAELVVAKNTLLILAARNTGRQSLETLLAGPTAVTFAYDNVAKVAKILLDHSKTPKSMSIRGGLLGRSVIAADGLDAVTRLPTREQALAGVVGSVAAPVAGVVGVLNAAVTNVLYALQARIDQLQPPSSEAAA